VTLLRSELTFAARQGTPLSVLLIDIDHFKRVNDTYGHCTGDVVLQLVAASIQRVLRPYDTLSRFGGEEFVVVARNADMRNAEILAERMRRRIQELPLDIDGREATVTVSVGVVSVPPEDGSIDLEELFESADEALYRAKNAGRNRVAVATCPSHGAPSGQRLRTTPPEPLERRSGCPDAGVTPSGSANTR
jgi:diguanylate cyclase (GGDEF)-like protein